MSKPSLRRKLLLHLLWPLCLTWALGSALVIGFAYFFVIQAYDRSLLDDAYALSAQVRTDANVGLHLSLTDAEMGSVLFDQAESNYFAIWRASGGLVAGHAALHPALPLEGTTPKWTDGVYFGQDVRVVSLARIKPEDYVVVVAQTTASRSRMLRQLLLAALLPQAVLLLLLAWWLRRQVRIDLQPLSELQKAVEGRDTADLSHVSPLLTEQARTKDIEHLGVAMNSLFDRLQLGIQAQREFSGNVAHELRTPLAGIRLQAEHALTLSTDLLVQQRMTKLLAGVDHASHLVDQLLALAFADEAEHSVPLVPIELTALVREAVLRHLPRADTLCVDFGADGLDAAAGISVLGDRVLMDAVLDNLIDNAFRYGLLETDRKVTVSIECDKARAQVRLSVQDNGVGLGGEADFYKSRWSQAHDYRQFSSTDPHLGATRGVGLGLAIVSRYAELLRAQFTLAPKLGQRGLCASLVFSLRS
jgi:two-component system, OmpR family, sensor histidine kinase TctE